MSLEAVIPAAAPSTTRSVALAGFAFLALYAGASVATGQRNVWLGDISQLVPPLAYAVLAVAVARLSIGQVRVFWHLNAIHCGIWIVGQLLWTYYDVARGGVPTISATDPIFFAASIPLAAALYGRPDRDRPRWLFDIVLLDIILIALFAAFVYSYFVVTLAVTAGPEEVYDANLTQLFNGRNLVLAAWAGWVWHTASDDGWRRVLGTYAVALAATFAGGIAYDFAIASNLYQPGSLWDMLWMAPYAIFALAAAQAYDARLFAPSAPAPPLASLPVVSLIAVALLILIPTIDEVARRLLDVPDAAQALRTRWALATTIPFGIVVVVREFLSRRALLRAGQDLVAAREELAQKEKLAAVGQLVSGVAHELNNPLQGVLGYAELMSLSKSPGSESEELRAIRENASRAAGIVRNLLTFAGRETPARSWQQINRIVEQAATKRRAHAKTSGTDIQIRLTDRLPLAYVDAARFEDVLLNLIHNAESAIQARRQSGAAGAAAPGEIIVTTRREANPDRILIEIADNGSGVRSEDLPRIFDPFFTTRGSGEGTGLGLSVCYGIVREHGGVIQARNRDTGGAVFTVELPATGDVSSSDARLDESGSRETLSGSSSAVEPSRAVRKRRALVVDDEASNAALVRRALERANYEVESTTLARRALVMIERAPYDAVIADVRMPELNGQELYTRACQMRPEIARRFIFITGDIDSEETLHFLEHSGCGYFMKPFNLERLTNAVDALVAAREAQ